MRGWDIDSGIRYCNRKYVSYLDVGMTSVCYTYDVAGDTASMFDSTIAPGTTFVATHPPAALDNVQLDVLQKIRPVIEVRSVPDYSDCTNMICPPNKNISAALSVRFMSEEEVGRALERTNFTVTPASPLRVPNASISKGMLVRARDLAGPKGQGVINMTVCPLDSNGVELYLYDSFPFSSIAFNAPLGYQAVNKISANRLYCCEAGKELKVYGAQVVVVRQLDPQPLSIAELEIYSKSSPGENLAIKNATCYSFPVGGGYYNGDKSTGQNSNINDGDINTYSHSTGSTVDSYDLCILQRPVDIEKIVLSPRQSWWGRSQNLSVEIYSLYSQDPSGVGVTPIHLLARHSVVHAASAWSGYSFLPSLQLPATYICEMTMRVRFETVNGEAYLLLAPQEASVSLAASMSSTVCPTDSFGVVESSGYVGCKSCPPTALSFVDDMAVCSGSSCSALLLPNITAYLPAARGVFARAADLWQGRPQYFSSNATLRWNQQQAEWELRNMADVLLATRGSSLLGPLRAKLPTAGAGDKPGSGIAAVAIEMGQDQQHLNLCEIEIFDDRGVNVAPTHARCFNFPIASSWYTGKADGSEPLLNDGCVQGQTACSCAHSGAPAKGNFIACVLNQSIAVSRVRVWNNPSWSSRSSQRNFKLFDQLPAGAITMESFKSPAVNLEHLDLSSPAWHDLWLCSLSIDAQSGGVGPADGSAAAWRQNAYWELQACRENRTWQALTPLIEQDKVRTGGMGGAMTAGKEEVWTCFHEHACLEAAGKSSSDWMCYVYNEETDAWMPWDVNSALKIFQCN